KPAVRISLGQPGHADTVGTDEVVGQEHVGYATAGQHLGFRHGGTLVPGDAGGHLHEYDLARLVRLDMRPKSGRAAGQRYGSVNVLANDVLVEQQCRTEYVRGVAHLITGVHEGLRATRVTVSRVYSRLS